MKFDEKCSRVKKILSIFSNAILLNHKKTFDVLIDRVSSAIKSILNSKLFPVLLSNIKKDNNLSKGKN